MVTIESLVGSRLVEVVGGVMNGVPTLRLTMETRDEVRHVVTLTATQVTSVSLMVGVSDGER